MRRNVIAKSTIRTIKNPKYEFININLIFTKIYKKSRKQQNLRPLKKILRTITEA